MAHFYIYLPPPSPPPPPFFPLSPLRLPSFSLSFPSLLTDPLLSSPSYLNANCATNPNSATGNAGGKILIQYIDNTKSMPQDLSLSLMKVDNADAGSYFNNLVLEKVGYGVSTCAFWGG